MKNRVRYFFLSLRIKSKFMLGMLVIILVLAIFIGNLTFYVSSRLIKRNTMELTTELLSQYAENIDNKAQALSKIAFQASKEIVDNEIFLTRNKYGKNIEFFVIRHFRDVVSQYRSANEYIEAVCMVDDNELYCWYNNNRYSIDRDYIKQSLIYLNRQMDSSLWIPTENDKTIMFISKMISPQTLITHGFIILFINKDYFLTLYDDTSIIKNEQIAIINDNNQILVTGHHIIGNEKELQRIAAKPQGSYSIGDKDIQYYGVSARIKNQNWKVISLILEHELLKNTKKLRKIIIIACIGISLIALIIAYIIAGGVTKNIRLLEKNMQKVEDGDFNVRVKPNTYDEVGLLTLRFNYMMKKINELINTVYIERIHKQEAEFEVLKAQINPHFLYNTLGSVKWLSRMKGEKKIEEMVDSLIYILRVSIKGDKYITIEDELDYVNKYIELQKIRFEDRFKLIVNVSDDIKACYLLQFILQPIVENAIYHGLEISKGNGVISINGYRKGDNIVLEVIDNGVGMTEDRYKTIIHTDNTKYSGLNSIGIANVNRRIKMYFGDQYGITIDSELGKGTSVSILLPYIKNRCELEDE